MYIACPVFLVLMYWNTTKYSIKYSAASSRTRWSNGKQTGVSKTKPVFVIRKLKMVLETSVNSQFDHITRLPARKKIAEISSHEQLTVFTRKYFVTLHSY